MKGKRLDIQKGLHSISASLSLPYDDKLRYRRELANSKIPSARCETVQAVQERVIGYLEKQSCQAWRRIVL